MKTVFVIGPAQHGKTTVRKRLAQVLGVKGASCSDFLYVLWSLLERGPGPGVLKERPKEESRPKLVALGNWITTDGDTEADFPFEFFPEADLFFLRKLVSRHPGALIQAALRDGVRVLDGVRRRVELEAALPVISWFGEPPAIVWVEDPRKERIPQDNLDIPASVASHIVLNDGSLEELDEKIFALAREILRVSDLDA